jgi:hypothetical protein
MGLGWRMVAPKPAKTAKRAMTRPAKTARQLATPPPLKKGASRVWRATRPETGVRQEAEGRWIDRTRRCLHGSASGAPAQPLPGTGHVTDTYRGTHHTQGDTLHSSLDPRQRSPEGYVRTNLDLFGWPRSTAQPRPIFRKYPALALLEAERLETTDEMSKYRDVEARLEALMVINKLYELQLNFMAELFKEAAEGDLNPDAVELTGRAQTWMENARVDWERSADQQNSLVARMDPAVAQRVADERATPHVQDIVNRAEAVENSRVGPSRTGE